MPHLPKRLAVVLMNLGAPDTLEAVRPFLRNLFSDPAIISLPWPLRPWLAKIISKRRDQKAREIYQQMGGGSPLLPNTKAQQEQLSRLLRLQLPDQKVEVFIAMRYWHPFTAEAVAQVKEFQPDEVVLLPLYPQFSTTTTGSIFSEWHKQAHQQNLQVRTTEIRCYPQDPNFIEAHVDLLKPWIEKAASYGIPRILFSAHGLPQRVVDAGDPYEKQVHQTMHAILKKVTPSVEGVTCYQSKIGPLKWLTPSVQEELRRAAKDKVPVIVVPVSFVSEHSETLVELDRDYYRMAQDLQIPFYGRVPALGEHPAYMRALADLVVTNKIGEKK